MKTEDLGMLILILKHKDSGFYLVEAPDNPILIPQGLLGRSGR